MEDYKPVAVDISLCVNNLCQNKCLRYQDNWQPSIYQSYINPAMKYLKQGEMFIPQKCNARMEE